MKRTIFLLGLFATPCFAGTHLLPQKVIGLANGWNGSHFYVNTDQQLSTDECSDTDKRAVLEDDHPQFELVSSLLLSALHAQSNVRLYVNGCGANNLMKITSVKIQT